MVKCGGLIQKRIIAIALLSIFFFLPELSANQSVKEAQRLNKQALKLIEQRQYQKALAPAKRALAIRERTLSSKHQDIAVSLNNLALIYDELGEYTKA